MNYRAGIKKCFDENHEFSFNERPSQQVTKSRQANSSLSFSGLPFPLTAKSRLLPVSYDEKSCLVQTQVSCDFRRFQLTVRMRIRAWGLIQGKEQVELKQAQELFCLRELVVSSNPRSELGTAKMPFFLKSHSKRWLFGTLKRQPTW